MHDTELSTNLIIQYVIVGAILLCAVGWIVWKLLTARKHGSKSCCGCSLSQNCGKKAVIQKADKKVCK